MTAQILRLHLVADHAHGAAQALSSLAMSRSNPRVVLTLVQPLPCERCEDPECLRVENWAKYEACELGDADEVTTDLAFETALISERGCIPKSKLRLIPLEDIPLDAGGNIIETWHDGWKESGRG